MVPMSLGASEAVKLKRNSLGGLNSTAELESQTLTAQLDPRALAANRLYIST